MAKVRALLLIATVLPILNGYPLEDDSSSSVSPYDTKQHPHDLKVNPLVAGKNQSNYDESNSTDATVLEETYIEVLLPGNQPINSSALEALLIGGNSNSSNSTEDDLSTPSINDDHLNTSGSTLFKSQLRPARDTSSEHANSSSNTPNGRSTVAPVLYSARVKRESDSRGAGSSNNGGSLEQNGNSSSTTTNNGRSTTVAPVLYSARVKRESDSKDASSSNNGGSLEQNANSSSTTTHGRSTVAPVLYSLHVKRESGTGDDSSSKEDSSEENANSSSSAGHSSTVEPVLYKRESDSKEDSSSSNEDSSEERENTPRVPTTLLSSSSQGSRDRAVRDTAAVRPEQHSNIQINRRVPTKPGSSTIAPALYSSGHVQSKRSSAAADKVSASSTEKVVFVTPQGRKLQPQNPYAAKQ